MHLPDGNKSLAKWLAQLADDTSVSDMISGAHAFEILFDLIKGDSFIDQITDPRDIVQDDDVFGAWMRWGEYLHSEYEIEQYAVVLWKK